MGNNGNKYKETLPNTPTIRRRKKTQFTCKVIKDPSKILPEYITLTLTPDSFEIFNVFPKKESLTFSYYDIDRLGSFFLIVKINQKKFVFECGNSNLICSELSIYINQIIADLQKKKKKKEKQGIK
ncbi:hypothetical protein M0811_02634 [Anaeramoeba ignava]|uniref:Uncharacterized protein n=1 Tax=Anaeramoeba ignava TaxID=1746090 RepID=A0A9Q0L942_ANAIG|nr:hypothetical protein M0811_02634 [Anaeramoeba ignava]